MGNIYLTGFMASGKSTMGELLAKKLGMVFVDLDRYIEEDSGHELTEIVEDYGVELFRKIEREALIRISRLNNCVVALGGGTALDRAAINILKKTGVTFWLSADAKTTFERVKKEVGKNHRPLFDDESYMKVMKDREKWYAKAEFKIVVDGKSTDTVVEEMLYFAEYNRMKKRDFLCAKNVKCSSDYDILISNKLEKAFDNTIKNMLSDKKLDLLEKEVVIITTKLLQFLYWPTIEGVLDNNGVAKKGWLIVEDEETNKGLSELEKIYEVLASNGLGKDIVAIAMGGGVIGDLVGLFASTYCRGIPLIHVPTTLLAIVDSSIGGKNGINLNAGKNLVGTIYQPYACVVGLDMLYTLESKEVIFGMAEVVKAAIIGDKTLFNMIEKNVGISGNVLDWDNLDEIIMRACDVKIALVEKDEKEKGDRRLLNLGHTVGHAIEKLGGYEKYSHGEAVSIGIMVSAHLAMESGRLSKDNYDRIENVLIKLGLPVVLPVKVSSKSTANKLKNAMKLDKKREAGKTNYVIPISIGECSITKEYGEDDIMQALTSLCARY